MKSFMIGLKHVRTTLAGVASIFAGLGLIGSGIQTFLDTGEIQKEPFVSGVGMIGIGWGLIMAKDADKSNAPIPEGIKKVATGLALFLALGLAVPAYAQDVDPTTSTVDAAGPADATAQDAPDPRWSFKLGTWTVAPAMSFTPMVISLSEALKGNFAHSIGPNVGAGLDWVHSTGWGAATHVTLRDTAVTGAGVLGSLYGIVPKLQQYKLRPGISYQFSDGAAPWKENLIFGVALSDNFGYQRK